jgi:hypothetical protein
LKFIEGEPTLPFIDPLFTLDLLSKPQYFRSPGARQQERQ